MLETLIDPLNWSVLLLVVGLLAWKRLRISRWFCAAALLLLMVFSSPAGCGALLDSLEKQFPDTTLEALPQAQAIVVLGGALHIPSPRHLRSSLIDPSDRILHALRLYRSGKAPLILCSGGGEDKPESPAMSRLFQEWGVPAEAILVDDQSLNTRENALFSYSLLNPRGVHHILLVTSAIHMPRAAAVFRKAGFEVTPAPADFRTGWSQGAAGGGGGGFFGRLSGWIPESISLQKSSRALREWIGLLIYRWRGWA